MSLYNKIKLAVFGFTLVILAAPVQAQFFQPLGPIDYYHNFQPFAPVELGVRQHAPTADRRLFFQL